jgi:small conductance mechanosensitive channel
MLLAQSTVEQACGSDRSPWLCRWVAEVTDSKTAADVGETLSPFLSILLLALGAVLVSRVARRLIRRTMRRWEEGGRFTSMRRRATPGVLQSSSPTPTIRRHQRAQTIAAGLSGFATIVVWVVAGVWMLSVLGVEASTLLTSAGLIGVALAFGAQNLLRDLIAGTFMIFEDQLGVGDVVDVGAASGTVEEVTLRTTRLRDVEGVVWHVPNGEIRRVGNKSQQWARAVVDIPIAAGADIERAQLVIKQTADNLALEDAWSARILAAPEVWGVESITLDAVTLRLVVKTAPSEQWRVARELRARIKPALDAAGIVSSPVTAADDLGPGTGNDGQDDRPPG